MMGKVISWALYFAFLAAVVLMGWNEPLKYRFFPRPPSSTNVGALVQGTNASSVNSPPNWMRDNSRWDNSPRAQALRATPSPKNLHQFEP